MSDFECYVREGLLEVTRARWREACKGLGYYNEHEGKRYCVLHFPGKVKTDAFSRAVMSKLEGKDYNFRGTVFPESPSNFQWFKFDANADFTGAIFIGAALFSGALFSGQTDFGGAQFSGEVTDFSYAQFSSGRASFQGFSSGSTSFQGAQFSGETHFSGTQFSGEVTNFVGAQFSGEETVFFDAQFSGAETSFQEATFTKEVYFTGATFKEKVDFWGSKAHSVFASEKWAWFDSVRIDKPELLTFNTVLLHPGWFINTDVRKVDFTDVKWYGMPGGPKGTLDAEIVALKGRDVESPHTLLAQVCRRLSANAEENREYPLANEFHYWSMDAPRKQGWRSLGLIGTLYWALSGYGVRARRALGVLLTIAVVFAVLYMLLGPNALQVSSASNPVQVMKHAGQAVVYSLSTMARLNPEPKPNPGLFQFLVTIEGILGPIQIALLALAIRRKVMR